MIKTTNLTENEEKICKMVRTHFNALRQRQKQSQDLMALTDDLKFTLNFINDSSTRPVPILRSMGIIILKKRKIALNLNMLQLQLMIPRNRTISSLHREGWKDAQEKYQNLVVPLVGENTAKDWLILVYPEDTEIAMYISQTPRLIATEANIRRSDINIQEAPKQQQNQNKESLFPLVSIQYERELFNTEVVDFIPLEEAVKTTKPKMEIVMCQSYDFRTAK